MPDEVSDGFSRYAEMTDAEREAFANRLSSFDMALGTASDITLEEAGEPALEGASPKQRELRAHAIALFVSEASGELAKAMSQSEGKEVPIGEAGVLLFESLTDTARRIGYRVTSFSGVIRTAPETLKWLGAWRPREAYGFIKGTRDNFLHVAAGDRPKRFGRGWKKRK